MQQFVATWIEMEIKKNEEKHKNIYKIRLGCFKSKGTKCVHVKYYYYTKKMCTISKYELWGNMDFSRALGKIIEILSQKYPDGIKVQLTPEGEFDFYLD